jgi:hypothetical protein
VSTPKSPGLKTTCRKYHQGKRIRLKKAELWELEAMHHNYTRRKRRSLIQQGDKTNK